MPVILNIETSSKFCSVALSIDGYAEFHIEDSKEMNHASALAPYVSKCLEEAKRRDIKIDAVAVSIGPGSYTGLRIGLSLAKGVCFGLDIPLITVSTLKMLATKAMFRHFDLDSTELLVPLIDARRMEVYTAAYNFALEEILPPQAMIITEESFKELSSEHKLVFIGNAVDKCKNVIKADNVYWSGNSEPYATDMVALAEMAWRKNEFADIAYAVPEYLKEYQAIIGKNKVLESVSK